MSTIATVVGDVRPPVPDELVEARPAPPPPRWPTVLRALAIAAIPPTLLLVLAGLGATLSFPMFRGYVMRVRAAEAANFMGEIRLHEEAYRAEHYRYLPVEWSPRTVPPTEPVPFDESVPGWAELGATPDGPVRFRYRVETGTPGAPPLGGAITGLDRDDYAFVMLAEADLDDDGDVMAVEGYSESDNLYLSHGVGGPPLERGWE